MQFVSNDHAGLATESYIWVAHVTRDEHSRSHLARHGHPQTNWYDCHSGLYRPRETEHFRLPFERVPS